MRSGAPQCQRHSAIHPSFPGDRPRCRLPDFSKEIHGSQSPPRGDSFSVGLSAAPNATHSLSWSIRRTCSPTLVSHAPRRCAKPQDRSGGRKVPAVKRARITGLLACAIGLADAAHAAGAQVCRPVLAVSDVRFSAMLPPTMERKWTAVVSVNASQCATTVGSFELGFSRLKENGPEVDFRERFTWQPPSVSVSVDFWADEAVESYWLNNVAPCPCRG